MAVTLRLVRLGRRHRPFFRLRAADKRTTPTGRFLEELGLVNPFEKDASKKVVLKKERIEHWLSQGAETSPTVKSLLKKHGVGRAQKL